MRINNNIMAMNAHRQLGVNSREQGKSIEKLSSGLRINRAGDDAAGLAISEKMRSQVRGLNKASRNAQDDISLIQTAEGALNETHAIIHRMREMAVQSANDSNTDADREALQAEMDQLAQEVTRISNDTEFNTRKLLNGNLDKGTANSTGDITFHIGANTNQNMKFGVTAMDAKSLGLTEDAFKAAASETAVGTQELVSAKVSRVEQGKGVTEVAKQMEADNKVVTVTTEKALDGKNATVAATEVSSDGVDVATFSAEIAFAEPATRGSVEGRDLTMTNNGIVLNATNKEVSINVDGAGAQTITLEEGRYETLDDLAKEINSKIQADTNLKDKVVALVDGKHLKFQSASVNDSTATPAVNSSVAIAGNAAEEIGFASIAAASTTGKWTAGGNTADTSSANIVIDATHNKLDIEFNGEKKTITLADGQYGGGAGGAAIADLLTDIQAKVDAEFGAGKIAVTREAGNDGGYTFETVAKGDGAQVKVTGGNAAASLGTDTGAEQIGATQATVVPTPVAGTDAEENNDPVTAERYNGITIRFEKNGADEVDASFSEDDKVITVKLSEDKTKNTASEIQDKIRALAKQGDYDFSKTLIGGTGEIDVDHLTGASLKFANGKDDTYKVSVQSKALDGVTYSDKTVVKASQKEVTFGNAFKGLTVKTNDISVAAQGTVKLDQSLSKAATFNADHSVEAAAVVENGINILSQKSANVAIDRIDSALKKVSDVRAGLGAVQNRLEHTIKNVDTSAENLQASESRIRDVDMAKEMMNYTKQNILNQAAQSMLAQANQLPQGVLQLLR